MRTKNQTLRNVRFFAKTRRLHACEITLTQVKPDSGRSPSLTFLYRAIRLESMCIRTPSCREAERYTTNGNDWRSETVQERTHWYKQHKWPDPHSDTHTHRWPHTPDRDLLGAQGRVWECVCVCVLIKHSSPSLRSSQCLVTWAPLPPLFSFPCVKAKNSFIHF